MSTLSRRWPLLLALAILLLDFGTKRLVLAQADTFRQGIPLIPGILRFTYVRNAGAAFGLFQGGRWPFVLVSVAAIVLLTSALARGHAPRLRRVAYAMILAGAAGNLIDRLFYQGQVVDFIEMGLRGHIFPVYNVADIGVSIGATLLVLGMLLESRGAGRVAPATASATSAQGGIGAAPIGPVGPGAPSPAASDDLARPAAP